ncbi:MAG: T9SS type A sorting domain-containing protein [Crocinitomicaceae bacterium]|nr:T9SS type A sorting domain-containing protein [Crocinitomicaceae bacterium]
MKIALLILSLLVFYMNWAQTVISQFTFNSNPVTQADIGPNAYSVSSSAFSDLNGTGGTNGVNAGLPKLDLDMDIAGSPTFDVPGIDVSFDYQRDESTGSFWRRGNYLDISMTGGNLRVTYRVDDGAGGYTQVNSGNAYTIPNDNTFRRYRFIYLNDVGVGYLIVNNTIVWTNDGPDNRDLYWVGAGDVRIGDNLDGSGSNRTFLDSIVVGSITNSALPINLVEFEAHPLNKNNVQLQWTTASEINNDYFTLEKSQNGFDWIAFATIQGAGNSSSNKHYNHIDHDPFLGLSYYRLKQTDFDGSSTYSDIESVLLDEEYEKDENWLVYPNPSNYLIIVENSSLNAQSNFKILNVLGQDQSSELSFCNKLSGKIELGISHLAQGLYFFQIGEKTFRFRKE